MASIIVTVYVLRFGASPFGIPRQLGVVHQLGDA